MQVSEMLSFPSTTALEWGSESNIYGRLCKIITEDIEKASTRQLFELLTSPDFLKH